MRHLTQISLVALPVLITATAESAAGQARQGPRPALERSVEIALARSAAPAAVSARSRVWIWNGSGYTIADSGETRVSCYVGRPWAGAIEPHCFDAEGTETILPIQIRRTELYAQGKTAAEADREIADGILAGKYRLPTRPVMSYMMSAAQHLVNSEGAAVGAWQPHLMIYFPYLKADEVGLPGFVPDLGFVENPGQALSTLVIPLRTFVPAPAGLDQKPR